MAVRNVGGCCASAGVLSGAAPEAAQALAQATLDWLDAPASLRQFHHAWNGLADPGGARWPGAVACGGPSSSRRRSGFSLGGRIN